MKITTEFYPMSESERAKMVTIGKTNPGAIEIIWHALDVAKTGGVIGDCPFTGRAAARWQDYFAVFKASTRTPDDVVRVPIRDRQPGRANYYWNNGSMA